MNQPTLKSLFGASVLVAVAFGSTAHSQTVTTDPVGFVSVTVPANSDAILAVPLNRAAEFKGVISSISGSVITVTGTPGWAVNQFVYNGTTITKTYAVQFASGVKEGMISKVTANTANTITVTLSAGDDFSGVVTGASGDQVDVMPYWTPSSLFTAAPPSATELFGFDTSGLGVNRGAGELYGYSGTSWEDEVTGDPASDAPLQFGSSYIVRNNSASALSLSMVGAVPMSTMRLRISTLANNRDQDVQLGYMSPVPESVISLGLPAVAGDSIIGFDNAANGKNKGAATIWAYDGTQWVDDITGDPLTSTVKLQPGQGYIYRKLKTATPQAVVWSHTPSYLQ